MQNKNYLGSFKTFPKRGIVFYTNKRKDLKGSSVDNKIHYEIMVGKHINAR